MNAIVTALFLVFTPILYAGLGLSQDSGGPSADASRDMDPRLQGEKAPAGRFPYMCSLRQKGRGEHKCGGVVIHRRWVLTTAHCVDPDFPGSVGFQPVIHCGIHEIDGDSPEMTFNADDGVLHPRWNGTVEAGFDIAMLKLKRKANTPIPKILAKKNAVPSGSRLIALGWRKTKKLNYSEKLHMTDNVTSAPSHLCKDYGYYFDDDSMVCAGLSHIDACEEDSGGPLLLPDAPKGKLKEGQPHLDLLVGISSYGLGSCRDENSTLGIYARVGYYSEWIQSVLGNTSVNQENKPGTETPDVDTMPSDAPEDEDSAPPSALEIDFDDDYVDHMLESNSESEDMEPTEGPSAPPSVSAQPPQTGFCATSPKLKDVVAAIEHEDVAIIRAALDCGLDPESWYPNNAIGYRKLLHWAVIYDSSDSAKVLIQSGAGVDSHGLKGAPLHYCGIFGSVSVAKVLLDNGAEVNAVAGYHLRRALHFAVEHRHDDVVKLLLDRGADVDAKDRNGYTPLHVLARNYGHTSTVKILVDAGADVDATDKRGNTPLHSVARWGNNKFVQVLIEEGADVDVKNEDGWTPLHNAAVLRGRADTIKILLDAGADIEATDLDGKTPLHRAAEYGRPEVVTVLVDAGASKTALSDSGDRPEDVICDRAKHPKCTRETRLAIEDLVMP